MGWGGDSLFIWWCVLIDRNKINISYRLFFTETPKEKLTFIK